MEMTTLLIAELTRAVYSGVVAAPISDFLTASPPQGLLILWRIMAVLLLALSQIIMNAQRIEYDYLRAQRRLEHDIAERERAADALSESETRFRLAFDNANTGMALVDLQGRFLKVNDRIGASVMVCAGSSRHPIAELMLILPGTTPEDARSRLEELRSAVTSLRLHCNGIELPAITISIGSAAADPHALEATDLIRRVDLALYRAKAQGRNCVVDFGG